MTTDAHQAVRLSSPAEWLQAVPYLFGFAPRESLVLLGLTGPRKRVAFQMRVDLPRDDKDVEPLAEHVAACLGRQPVERVLAVLYGDDAGPPSHRDRALWQAVADRLGDDVEVVDALVVRDGRWWSLVCADPRCCPLDGTPWSPDDSSRVAAELVLRGLVARDSRDEVAAEVAPYGGPEQVLLAQRCDAFDEASWELDAEPFAWSLAWVDAAVERWRAAVTAPADDLSWRDPDALAAMLAPLRHKTLRDRVAGVCLKHSARAKPVLREVVRRAPLDHVAPPATILGLLEWADGDGIRASIAFERALSADPEYSFALMLHHGLQHGIRLTDDFLDDIRDMARRRWRNPSGRRRAR